MQHSHPPLLASPDQTAGQAPGLRRPHLLHLVLIGLSALVLHSHSAAAKDMYKWTDENGVLHYTDKRPTGVEAETITKKTRRRVQEEAEQEAAQQEQQAAATSKKANAERCKTEQDRLKTLNSSKSIRMKMEDGTVKILSPEDIAQEVAFARKAIDYFCE